jgi:B-cell receptor-associated protein 31
MIQLLFSLLAAEAALVVVLLFRTPARRLALLAVDRSKRGRGPIMARTVAATMLIVLGSSGYSIAKIRRREGEFAQLTPTDQVLASRHLLEASLMGTLYIICAFSILLGSSLKPIHHHWGISHNYFGETPFLSDICAVICSARTLEPVQFRLPNSTHE